MTMKMAAVTIPIAATATHRGVGSRRSASTREARFKSSMEGCTPGNQVDCLRASSRTSERETGFPSLSHHFSSQRWHE